MLTAPLVLFTDHLLAGSKHPQLNQSLSIIKKSDHEITIALFLPGLSSVDRSAIADSHKFRNLDRV
jgi:hypothetical protein